jgi:hypothetical protein
VFIESEEIKKQDHEDSLNDPIVRLKHEVGSGAVWYSGFKEG